MKAAIRGNRIILQNEAISEGIYELRLEAPEIARTARAGQFVNIYLPGGEMLLPRPMSIADNSDDALTLVYAIVGKGTEALAKLCKGESIEMMGPLGTGFLDLTDDPPKRILLIGGGVGIPPLYFAARQLKEKYRDGVIVEAALGFREIPWYVNEFSDVCDSVGLASENAASDSVLPGNVLELLDRIYAGEEGGIKKFENAGSLALACGPQPMLRTVSEWCIAGKLPLRVSLEERMGCGYGACAGCSVKTKPDPEGIVRKKACVDGPVFWADEVVW